MWKRQSLRELIKMDMKNIPQTIQYKLNNLKMLPMDWSNLNRLLSPPEYQKVVSDYQKRENNNRKRCKSMFGLCRYYCGGKCLFGKRCIY